jgi:prepilin-type N-terminal cleavage/methylation domain-containing protein
MLSARAADRSAARCRSAPAGLSLVEVIVVLALLGVAATAIGRIGVGQQSHYRDLASRMQARAALREGMALLGAELRGISPGGGDLYPGEMRDASIAFRSTVGSAVLCDAPPDGASAIDVVSIGGRSDGDSTTSGAGGDSPASAGDSVWLYASGRAADASDDRWLRFTVLGVARLQSECVARAAFGERDAFRLSLSGAVHGVTEPHAPVSLFRRVRYALYQSSDGQSYLGFSDCRPVVRNPPCASMQPVSGPYAPNSARGGSGLVLTYLDGRGVPTADPLAVARIGIVLRARTGDAGRIARDAVRSEMIALRNAARGLQ